MSDRHTHFYRDAPVEVFSTEAGSYGTRYEATLLDSPSTRSSKRRVCKVPVEYRTLLSDEDESQPLREHVELSLLRPPPPAERPSSSKGFELYDVVDAYYKDGWWEGIVNAVIDTGGSNSFSVLFQNPSDQIPFPTSNLRLHLDWVDGKWVRPQKKRLEEMIFSSGASVEVNLKVGVGTDATWIPAKVLKETGNNSYLVEYKSSSKGVAVEHQPKTVDIHHIRPVPPSLEKSNLGLLDKVEAFFDFGWRGGGLVTKLLPDKRYRVFFKDSGNMEKELNHSELRLPLIWKDGRWLTLKDVKSLLPEGKQEQERTGLKNGQKREMSPPRPVKKLKGGHEEVLPKCQPVEQLHGSANPTTTPCYGYISSKKPLVDDLSSSDSERPLQERKIEFIVEQESGLKLPSKKRGRPRKSALKEKKNNGNAGDAADTAVENLKPIGAIRESKDEGDPVSDAGVLATPFPGRDSAEDGAGKEQVMKEVDLLVSPRLTSLGLDASLNSRLNVRKRSHRSKVLARWPRKEIIDDGKHSQFSNLIGKRERKSSSACPSPNVSCTDEKNEGNDGGDADLAVGYSKSDDAKTDEKNEGNAGGDADMAVGHSKSDGAKTDKNNKVHEDAFVASDSVCVPSNLSDKMNEQDSAVSADCVNMLSTPALDKRNEQDPVVSADCANKFLTPTLGDFVGKNGGDSCPAADYGGIHSPPVSGLAPRSIVNQGNESSGRDEELETPVIHATCPSAQVRDECCFSKKSPFWKHFEDVALFKKMPQNPHFSPLKDCKEVFREGRAIGYMMGFMDLAEQASGLTIDDPRCTFDHLLENLRELEVVGFDVKALQDQVNKVLTVKLKKSDLLIQTQEIEKQLAEHEQQKLECDEKEDELEKAIKELKEKYTSVVAKKKKEEFEITLLRSRIADLIEITNHLGNEFESVSC